MSRIRIWVSVLVQFVFGLICASFAAFLGLGIVLQLLEIAGWLSESILKIWVGAFIICGVTYGSFSALREYRDLVQERNVENGLCDKCGYDLRESPDRCPECGAIVRKKRRK
jgi:hypothetical protein